MSYQHVLDDDEKRELLRIARATLREHLASGRVPPGKPHKKTLLDHAAAFVTIHRGGELRGCIGNLRADTPLYKTVQEMAVAAASRDSRFSPVTADEMPDLVFEISVLGANHRVRGPEDVAIGAHGLSLSLRGRRGLLLPQVAVEHDWDAVTFLDRVCHKAGVPEGTWRDAEAELEAFTAQVFSDVTHPRV
jgi:AmmeMemoRadiSam system protein A